MIVVSLKQQLMADMKAAMKAKENGKLALNVIRMARAHIRQAEIDNGHADFDDDQVLTILRKEVKQRKETLAEIKDSGREDLVEATQAEIDILQKYLPAELSAEAVKKVVVEIVNAMNPEDRKMGLVMKSVMAKLRGKADGKLISTVVREILAE
ncbi:GatB/Yqey family protein [Dialister micraerophilus DSM 19965]|uniref:GatB/Yqey family protein n=1 Tax=Dialister micraerophilus DSM 19965 TaxID=888062 RepID=F2BY71_9FIRM|nr:GatB/Yqey family protein [Dialister micraerophilus DSM 19965]